jgi:hypothetical protein
MVLALWVSVIPENQETFSGMARNSRADEMGKKGRDEVSRKLRENRVTIPEFPNEVCRMRMRRDIVFTQETGGGKWQ